MVPNISPRSGAAYKMNAATQKLRPRNLELGNTVMVPLEHFTAELNYENINRIKRRRHSANRIVGVKLEGVREKVDPLARSENKKKKRRKKLCKHTHTHTHK